MHWWYNSRPHAAELTAGYYNVREGACGPERNGYDRLVRLCSKYNTRLNFTCVEMRDCEHPEMVRACEGGDGHGAHGPSESHKATRLPRPLLARSLS